jgi:hypothetical protein
MRAFKTVMTICVLGTMSVPAIHAGAVDQDRFGRRIPLRATLETTSHLVYSGDAAYDAGCAGAPMADVIGVGNAQEFGLVRARQAHCLGTPDFTADPVTIPIGPGSFKLTDGRGRTITGHYRGRLVQTFNAGFNELGPTGVWLIDGEACVSGGTIADHIVDDCTAGRYSPMKGIQNLDTQQATLFLDQTFGARDGR